MKDFMEYLPEQYRNSAEVAEIQKAFQRWAEKLHSERDSLYSQFYPRSATWGLELALAKVTFSWPK